MLLEQGRHGQPTRIVSQSRQGVPGGALRNQYGQWLGYESPAHGDVPGTGATGSYAGRITQVREQFGSDQNVLTPSPMPPQRATRSLKTANMTYDAAGRLVKSDVWVANGVSYGADDLGTSVLWAPEGTLGAQYTFDENNRLDAATIGGATPALDYVYEPGSNRLKQVTGTFKQGSTRNAGAPDNFTWTADGNLSVDNSKSKWVGYDADGLPSYIGSGNSAAPGGEYIWPLYDADGQMVSALSQVNRPVASGPTSRVHYVRLAGAPQKEIRETWNYVTSSVTGTVTVVNLIGQSAVVGRKVGSDRQYYLKNHQGSVVKVVDAEGKTLAAYDYTAYGDLRTLTDPGTRQTDKWTGKEYFEGPGLYYFGARWYDPELGLWISPDPAHEGMSPYAYVGGDPMNYIDPYGLWKIGAGITVGWDSKHGFNVGVGFAADDIDLGVVSFNTDVGHSWNSDGTTTTSVAVGGGANIGVVQVNGGVGVSYNTQDGTAVFGHVGAGAFGLNGEVGALQWMGNGEMHGGYAYGMGYLGTAGNHYGVGYQAGWGGQRSGFFQEAKAMGFSGRNFGDGWQLSGFSANVASVSVDQNWNVSGRHYGNELASQWSDFKLASSSLATLGGIGLGVYNDLTDRAGTDTKWEIDSRRGVIKVMSPQESRFYSAITLGRVITFAGQGKDFGTKWSSYEYGGQTWDIDLGEHEYTHVGQWESMGFAGFLANYRQGGQLDRLADEASRWERWHY